MKESFLIWYISSGESTIPAPEPESPYPPVHLSSDNYRIPRKREPHQTKSWWAWPATPFCEHGFISRKDAKTQSLKYESYVLEDIFRVSASLREYFPFVGGKHQAEDVSYIMEAYK